jgi:hypothetical protein
VSNNSGAPAFSNSDDYELWAANWCRRCLIDAPFREGRSDTGCDILLTALVGIKPAEWLELPAERRPYDAYHCVNFRGPDDPDTEPKPQPEPPDMDGLFERPERRVRMFVQPQEIPVVVGEGAPRD